MPWRQCYKTMYFRITDIFSVFLYLILQRYNYPFSVLRKYFENVHNTKIRSIITLEPGISIIEVVKSYNSRFAVKL